MSALIWTVVLAAGTGVGVYIGRRMGRSAYESEEMRCGEETILGSHA